MSARRGWNQWPAGTPTAPAQLVAARDALSTRLRELGAMQFSVSVPDMCCDDHYHYDLDWVRPATADMFRSELVGAWLEAQGIQDPERVAEDVLYGSLLSPAQTLHDEETTIEAITALSGEVDEDVFAAAVSRALDSIDNAVGVESESGEAHWTLNVATGPRPEGADDDLDTPSQEIYLRRLTPLEVKALLAG